MKNYIIYDLETNGLDLQKSAIMQITILDNQSDILMNEYVYPYDNNIQGTEIHGIDEHILKNKRAITLLNMCVKIKEILRHKFYRDDIYWVAYNNFGFDQLILESNFRISNIKIPTNWYFIDLFPLIKELYPSIKPNYKLKTVYETLINSNNNITFHSSLEDTKCLYQIFNKVFQYEKLFDKYTRSLMSSNLILNYPLTTLNGYNEKMRLDRLNIHNIGDLVHIYKTMNYDNQQMYNFLNIQCNIYVTFYVNNIIKQLDIIRIK